MVYWSFTQCSGLWQLDVVLSLCLKWTIVGFSHQYVSSSICRPTNASTRTVRCVPSERGFPYTVGFLTEWIRPLYSSRCPARGSAKWKTICSRCKMSGPVFMTAAQIRNFRALTAAAVSFDAIPERFRTQNPQVLVYVVINPAPAEAWHPRHTNGEQSARPGPARRWKLQRILQPDILLCCCIRQDSSYVQWNLCQGRQWPFSVAPSYILWFICTKYSLQACAP